MNEIYIVNGQEYSVGPANLQKFLSDFPNAVKKDTSGKPDAMSQSALVEPETALNTESNL